MVGGEGLEPPETVRSSRLQRDAIAAMRTALGSLAPSVLSSPLSYEYHTAAASTPMSVRSHREYEMTMGFVRCTIPYSSHGRHSRV